MNYIKLKSLYLKTFTEQDVLDYCQLNNLNSDNITELDLSNNRLTNISGIRHFKNLKILYLENNYITDISVLKDLENLENLDLSYNEIKDISDLKNLNKLKTLLINVIYITDTSVIKNLNSLETLGINYLNLESNQIKYIQSLKNLKYLYSRNGFKDMKVLKQLNQNLKVIK